MSTDTTAPPSATPAWKNTKWGYLTDAQKREWIDHVRKETHLSKFTVDELWRYRDLTATHSTLADDLTDARRKLDDLTDEIEYLETELKTATAEQTACQIEIEGAASNRALEARAAGEQLVLAEAGTS